MKFYSISLPNVTPLKLVTGKATYGIGFLTAFVGSFCSLFGIPNNMFAEKLKKAEALAMEELTAKAKVAGADGVMDVRCQIDGLSFLVSGTAYKLSPEEKANQETEENSTICPTRKAQEYIKQGIAPQYIGTGYTCPVCKMSMDVLIPCEKCGYIPPHNN